MSGLNAQHCCDPLRRNAVAAHATLNGIDWIEVLDHELPPHHRLRQRTLLLRCLKPLPVLTAANVRIEGGERLRNIGIEWAACAEPLPAQLLGASEAAVLQRVQAMSLAERGLTLVVRCKAAGDFSTYRLRLLASATEDLAPAAFDTRLASIDFRFKVECPTGFDCKDSATCANEPAAAPDIDYLARDYTSFRRLLLDRIAQTSPAWELEQVPDGGMALVELLAYVGDQLSYRQDAIATEAYLDTARRRVSLRRHAKRVDYRMHDGCNARAWMQVKVKNDVQLRLAGTAFLTACALPRVAAPDQTAIEKAIEAGARAFEPIDLQASTDPAAATQALFADHNELAFHTWSDERCCLERGATSATLTGSHWNLRPGMFLLFEEVFGPVSGAPEDADPAHRHILRLTSVSQGTPARPLLDRLLGTPVCEIAWADEDALPFSLCLSSITDAAHGKYKRPEVSVARGNLVLADHGRTQPPEDLPPVPEATLFPVTHGDRCEDRPREPLSIRYRPQLARGPLTCAAPLPKPDAPAAAYAAWTLDRVQPQIRLAAGSDPLQWTPRHDLLKSQRADRHFVAETDDDQRTRLRFGDDEYGMRPNDGTAFKASYRTGQGTAGNLGADSLLHVLSVDHADLETVRNPLASIGGTEPESNESLRRRAPQAFRTQQRAVTESDYAQFAGQFRGVQRAQARLRWTGSWHTVFVAVDQQDAAPLTEAYEAGLIAHLDRYRMAGHDLEIDEPVYVPLGIALHVCVKPDYFREHVRAGLLTVLGSRALPDGRKGLFHPDNFSFGQTVYLSPVYATAHTVPGVDSVKVTVFGPQDAPDARALADGKLELGRRQIARLDNDRNYPERGRLLLQLDGGK